MSEINYLIHDIGITNITIFVFAILFACKAAAEALEWLCEKTGIETRWSLRQKHETKMLFAHEAMIQKLTTYQHNTHNEVKEIHKLLESHILLDNERTVATLRTTLYQLHKAFVTQKYISNEELKTFMELGRVYEEAGGDDIYHSKLEPEVLALPIK